MSSNNAMYIAEKRTLNKDWDAFATCNSTCIIKVNKSIETLNGNVLKLTFFSVDDKRNQSY